jgi:hypothetical protein
MLRILGVLINLGIVAHLGFQAKECLNPALMADFNIVHNPLVLSFVAVVALFIALNN